MRLQFDQSNRRQFITLLGGTAVTWPLAVRAQQPGKLPTIGFLGGASALVESQWAAAFVQRLHELGWTEGWTIAIEYRWAEGRNEPAEIVAEFVRLKVDIIVTYGTPSILAAKQATSAIPIVFAAAGDPVRTGIVASLARPGGNVTGLSLLATDLTGKRIDSRKARDMGMSPRIHRPDLQATGMPFRKWMTRYEFELFGGINSDLIQSPWTKLYARTTKMPSRTKTALAALLFFGSASAVLADTTYRTDHYGSVPRRVVPVIMSNGRTGAVDHAVRPFIAEEKAWFAAPQPTLVQSAPFCVRGITGTRMAWIKLTEPGGKLIHINVEQVTSVRSDTQIPGANAQLDLTSGKLQGVQENVDQVMELITATAGARANDECA